MSTETEFGALLDAIRVSVAGLTEPWPGGPLDNPDTATGDAFAAAIAAQPVDAGAGLWALLRTSPDRTSRVLCAHNISDRPVSFDPAAVLGDGELRFVHGRMRTQRHDDGIVRCQLEPRSFVWLSNITAGKQL